MWYFWAEKLCKFEILLSSNPDPSFGMGKDEKSFSGCGSSPTGQSLNSFFKLWNKFTFCFNPVLVWHPEPNYIFQSWISSWNLIPRLNNSFQQSWGNLFQCSGCKLDIVPALLGTKSSAISGEGLGPTLAAQGFNRRRIFLPTKLVGHSPSWKFLHQQGFTLQVVSAFQHFLAKFKKKKTAML